MPRAVAIGLTGYVAAMHRFDVGVVWLVGFHCFLRSGEMFGIRARDVSFARDCSSAVINLGLTKTGKRQGASESVTVSDGVVLAALRSLVQKRRPGELLASLSGPGQRAFLKKACEELGFRGCGLSLYSLRRGGATHDLGHRGFLDRTIVPGR